MATISQEDTIIEIDISDDLKKEIDQAEEDKKTPPLEIDPILIDGVTVFETDADEVRLNSEEGIFFESETTGSTLLTGNSLQGTAERPASLGLVTDGSKEVQVVAVNTSNVSNTVITTAESVDGSTVAAAEIVVRSDNVEAVSIKTASTERKSEVLFAQTTESLAGVRIEMEGAGGNLDVQSASVDNLQVKAAGEQFSEITFGAEVEKVTNAQIEIGQSGGSLQMEGGTLSSSTIAIESDTNAINEVLIGSNVTSVSDTTLELSKGSANVGIASDSVNDVKVFANSKSPTTLVVDSEEVNGFTLSVSRSTASLDLASKSKISGTTLASTTKNNINASIDAVTENTTISNTRKGEVEVAFSGKAINPSITNEGKGAIEANFDSVTRGAELESTRGDINASFSGKVKDILVEASSSKGDVSISFDSVVSNANLSFGRGSDDVIFGGSVTGSSSVDLGSDKNSDSVTIEKPKKVKSPLTISNFGPQDVLTLGASTFTYAQISEFDSTDSFPSIFGDNIIVELA